MSMLEILATASYLPPVQPAREVAAAAGADVTAYRGWPNIAFAGPDDHPSTMAAEALTKALAQAGIDAQSLDLVIFGGMSRDYPPSWSVAAELMKVAGCPDTCLSVDLTQGCMGGLVALDFAAGWLQARGGGHAAVVCAERWTHTVNRSNPESMSMWGIGDGAAVTIVAVGSKRPILARYCGAAICSQSDLNGHVLVRYGGTRFPQAPAGVNPSTRALVGHPKEDVRALYLRSYALALQRMRERFDVSPDRLICNQISHPLLEEIAALAGVPLARTIETGRLIGHIGSADLQIGLEQLLDTTGVDGPVAVAASTPYLFGAGLLLPG